MTMVQSALKLAQRGLPVFPLIPGDKIPLHGSNGYLDATTDPDKIAALWSGNNRNCNIGSATGHSFFTLDVDDMAAETALQKLEAQHGAIPPTVEVITSRGRHLHFKMPATPVRCSAGKIAPHLDIRGLGGFVVLPPSLHPSGKRYCWSIDCHHEFAPAPDWLLEIIREPAADETQATPPEEWRALVEGGVDAGARDCTVTKLAGHLLRKGVDPFVVYVLLKSWNETQVRPPLPAEDIARIFGSIAAKEVKRLEAKKRAYGR